MDIIYFCEDVPNVTIDSELWGYLSPAIITISPNLSVIAESDLRYLRISCYQALPFKCNNNYSIVCTGFIASEKNGLPLVLSH